MSQKSYLQIMFKEIGIDDNFEVYSESIKSIHQYGGCDFYVKKCVPTDKIMVSFIQYPEINLNYPVSTNEWLSNQWLFRNESGVYRQCGDVYNEDGNYFLFEPQNGSDSDNYDSTFSELYLAAIFNLAGHYAIEFTELDSNNNAVDRVVVYAECVDIKTLNISLPFNTESVEFSGWNKSLNRSIYSLTQQIGNNFRMIYIDGEYNSNSDSDSKTYQTGDVVAIDNTNVYNGFMDSFFTIAKNESEKDIFGVIVENPINCFFRNGVSDYLKPVTIYKLAYTGLYRTMLPYFSESSKVYFDLENKIVLPDKNAGEYVGEYDADNCIFVLERNLNGNVSSSIYNYYDQFISECGTDKFSISHGDCLKFTELYDDSSINIEESGLNYFALSKGNLVVTNPKPTYIIDDSLDPFHYVIDNSTITYYVVFNEEYEQRQYAPKDLSLVKWSKKGAVCDSVSEQFSIDNHSDFDKLYSTGNNSKTNWLITKFINETNHLFKFRKYNGEELSSDNEEFYRVKRYYSMFENTVLSYDFYGIDENSGIIATVERIMVQNMGFCYFISLSTNKKESNIGDIRFNNNKTSVLIGYNLSDDIPEVQRSEIMNVIYSQIDTNNDYSIINKFNNDDDDVYITNVRNPKIIKHNNCYALYFITDYNDTSINKTYSRIGCITFYANYGTLPNSNSDEEIGVMFSTANNYFETDINYGLIDNFKVSSINNENDIIVTSNQNKDIKIFVSSELNRFGEMTIQYVPTNSLENDMLPTEIRDFNICKVDEDICVFITTEFPIESSEEKPIYNVRFITYDNNNETESNISKPYTINIVHETNYQSPVMKEYAAAGNNNCMNVIPVGNKSFIVQYGVGNYIRMAIGTVNVRIENEVKSIDVFWQELKDAIIEINEDETLTNSMLCKSDLYNGDEMVTSFNVISNGSGEPVDIMKSVIINTVSINDIMGIASIYSAETNRRKICYYGECKIDNNDRFKNSGINVYADDFGNLCKTPMDNFLGQYIGNDTVIKK